MVEVLPASLVSSLQAGSDSRVAFTIRNLGPAARYTIVATAGHGVVTRAEPVILELGAGAEQQIEIPLKVPGGLAAGTDIDVFVSASSDGPRPTSNSAVMHLRIRE
jgi:uncharacterized membrane protein